MSTTVITKTQLSAANGVDGAAIWVALYNPKEDTVVVYDVSSRPDFYGPEGSYGVFAARDASRALATMDLKEEKSNVDDLTEDQLKVLQDWNDKYVAKYPVIGVLEA